jgi:AcrR family transcriptional regulator
MMSVKATPTIAPAATPRRRPGAGGYARGEETRARIVAAALEVFGAEGFERGSTRQIAALAGVPPPALQYYFDGKEGLHRACAEFIIERISRALSPALDAAEQALAGAEPKAALDALCGVIDTIVEFSVDSPDAAVRSRFIGRGQADGAGPALPLIRERISRPLHALCSRLVGLATGMDPKADETRLRATAVLSPLTAFHINRANTLEVMSWADFGGDRSAIIKAVLRAHTRSALTSCRRGSADQSARATPPSTGIVAPTT